MATGHHNPSYGDPVSRLKRVRSALLSNSMAGARAYRNMFNIDVDESTLDQIKERAKEMWMQPEKGRTTYKDHFKERYLDVSEITKSRPTSANRKNKPHPSEVFLTTRLHNIPGYGRLNDIPGYHNPDTTIGKEPYRVDRSLPDNQQAERNALRLKYTSRPHTAAVNQYRTIPELEAIRDPVERQGTEAWLKLARKRDKEYVLSSLRKKYKEDIYRSQQDVERSYQNNVAVYSYPRSAGIKDSRPHDGFGIVTRNTLRQQDIRNSENVRFHSGPSKRGDFCIHPEWTPKIPHHRLNGLSSLDVPYLSNPF